MKLRDRFLCRIMVDCLSQAPALFFVPYSRRFSGGLCRRPLSSSAVDRIPEKEEDLGNQRKKKEPYCCSAEKLPDFSTGQNPLALYFSTIDDDKASSSSSFQSRDSCKPCPSSNQINVVEHGSSVSCPEVVLCKNGSLSPKLVASAMRSVIDDWEMGLRVFSWARRQPNFRHSSETFELIVYILGKAEKFGIMWNAVEEIAKEGYLFSPRILEVIFRSYIKVGKFEDAVKALDRLVSLDCKMGTKAFNSFIRVLCYERKMKDCQMLLERTKNANFLNETSYNILVHGFCQANMLREALNLLEEMISKNYQPSLATYTSLIEILSTNNAGGLANKLFDHMKTCILQKFSGAKEAEHIVDVLALLKATTSSLDSMTYESLITSLCALGELVDAFDLLEEMLKKKLAPSTKIYRSIFSQLCKRKLSNEAFELFNNVNASSFMPDLQILNSLIETFCSSGNVSMALEVWNKMHEKGLSYGLESYSVLIHGLCYNNLFEEGLYYFKEMIKKGIVPLHQTYKMLQFGFLKSVNSTRFDELKLIAKQIEENGWKLSQPRKQWRKR